MRGAHSRGRGVLPDANLFAPGMFSLDLHNQLPTPPSHPLLSSSKPAISLMTSHQQLSPTTYTKTFYYTSPFFRSSRNLPYFQFVGFDLKTFSLTYHGLLMVGRGTSFEIYPTEVQRADMGYVRKQKSWNLFCS